MSNFPDKIQIDFHSMRGDSMVFVLEEDFRYNSAFGWITIPKGFPTDGASVPRVFWGIFPPTGPYFPAAVVHDYLYSQESNTWLPLSRLEADLIFLQAMADVLVSELKRSIIFTCVRLGGWRFFKKK